MNDINNFILILFSPFLIDIAEDEQLINDNFISSNIKHIAEWYQNEVKDILDIHLPEDINNKINVEFIPYNTQIIAKITYNKIIYDDIDYYAKVIIDPDDDGNYCITLNKKKYLVGANSYSVKCI